MKQTTMFAIGISLFVFTGCGSGGGGTPSSPSTPTTPTTPTAPTNRAPVINSLNFAPAFGIAQLTQFSFNASASDPDGDAVTYSWDVGGNAFTGSSGTIVFSSGGQRASRRALRAWQGGTPFYSPPLLV